MFYKHTKNDKVVVLIVYVNDIILTGNDEIGMSIVTEKLVNDFKIKDLRSMKYLLAMEFARSKVVILSTKESIFLIYSKRGSLGCRIA